MKYTILTCLFGDYDTLKDPEEIDEDAKYICITDRKDLQSNVWNIIYDPFYNTDKLNLLFVGYDLKRKGIDEAFGATQILREEYGTEDHITERSLQRC